MMKCLQMKVGNDYQYLLFQVFRSTSLVMFLSWAFVFCLLKFSSEEVGYELLLSHLSIFWLMSGTAINFIIVPYYVFKSIKIFGFSSFDYLDEWSSGKRSMWDRKKIIRNLALVMLAMALTLQFGGIKSYLILNRYSIDTVWGYSFISIIIWLIMSVSAVVLSHIGLSCIQYKFSFKQIPNKILQDMNRKEPHNEV